MKVYKAALLLIQFYQPIMVLKHNFIRLTQLFIKNITVKQFNDLNGRLFLKNRNMFAKLKSALIYMKEYSTV